MPVGVMTEASVFRSCPRHVCILTSMYLKHTPSSAPLCLALGSGPHTHTLVAQALALPGSYGERSITSSEYQNG